MKLTQPQKGILGLFENYGTELTLFSIEQDFIDTDEKEIQDALDSLVEMDMIDEGIEEISDDHYYYVYTITPSGMKIKTDTDISR